MTHFCQKITFDLFDSPGFQEGAGGPGLGFFQFLIPTQEICINHFQLKFSGF